MTLTLLLGGGVVDRPGFEPGTSRVQAERSSRLSYRPTWGSMIDLFSVSLGGFYILRVVWDEV